MDVENETGDRGELFSPVSVGRISQVIVDQVRLLIRERKLRVGDRLPSERALCEKFGVSRVTVREALRVLEAGGLVEIKVGSRGGAIVCEPSSARVGENIADLLTLSSLTAAEVTEARMLLEMGIIPHVIERATAEDVEQLEALCRRQREALEENRHSTELSAAFHVQLAACTHNAAIEMLVGSFHGPIRASLDRALSVAPIMGERGVEEHFALVEAIRARDVEAASAVMKAHLNRTAERVASV